MLNIVVFRGSSLRNMIECVDEICCSVKVVSSGNLIIIFSVMIVSVGNIVVVGCCWFSVCSSVYLSMVVMLVCVVVRNSGFRFVIVIWVVGSELVKIIMLINLFI